MLHSILKRKAITRGKSWVVDLDILENSPYNLTPKQILDQFMQTGVIFCRSAFEPLPPIKKATPSIWVLRKQVK